MSVLKAARLALVVLAALLAIPAATVHAAQRMPIGFFDDPSFRWSPTRDQNLHARRLHRRVRDPHDGHLGRARADEAGERRERRRPRLQADRPRRSRLPGGPAQHARDDQHHRHAEVGERRQGAERDAEEAERPDRRSRRCSRRATTGAHGHGSVSLWSVWNEPNLQLFLTPQFVGKKIVGPANYAKLFKAAYAGIKAGNPLAKVAIGETSARGRDKPLPGVSATIAPGTFARLLSQVKGLKFDAWAHHPYPTSPNLPPMQKVRYPNVTLSTLGQFEKDLNKWFHRTVPIWITEYGHETKPAEPHGVTLAQQAAYAKQALTFAKNDPNVQMFIWFTFRDSAGNPWQSGLVSQSGAQKPAFTSFGSVARLTDGSTVAAKAGVARARDDVRPVPRALLRSGVDDRDDVLRLRLARARRSPSASRRPSSRPTSRSRSRRRSRRRRVRRTRSSRRSTRSTGTASPARRTSPSPDRRAARDQEEASSLGQAQNDDEGADGSGDAAAASSDARRGRDRRGAEQQEVHQQRRCAEQRQSRDAPHA